MHGETEESWFDAGSEADFQVGSPTLIRQGDHHVLVVRTQDNEVRAIDNRCPHEGYPLKQGVIRDCVVTCPWHNFKFDLRDGSCLKGEEAVRVYDVQRKDGRVYLDLHQADPQKAKEACFARIEEGLRERRLGQIARECTRALQLGVEAFELAAFAAVYDARHGEYGSNHGLPVAADILGYFSQYSGVEAVLPIMQAMDLASEDGVRRTAHPKVAAFDPGDDPIAAGQRFADFVEREEGDAAQALLAGALAKGWRRKQLEPWFSAIVCEHFLDFGHAIIYQSKIFDFIDAIGWRHAEDLLAGFLRRIANGTRENTLPRWQWTRGRLTANEANFPSWWARNYDVDGVGDVAAQKALYESLIAGGREAMVDRLVGALEAGVGFEAIADALVAAACERVIRFEASHEANYENQNGWLDVTHCFTTASALRTVMRRNGDPHQLRALFWVAHFIHESRVLDAGVRPAGASPIVTAQATANSSEHLPRVQRAIFERDGDQALAQMRAWLAQQGSSAPKPDELLALRRFAQDLPLQDHYVRPIVMAHALKFVRAAFDEYDARIASPWRVLPLFAMVRFAGAKIHERQLCRLVHEARRLVIDGAVPRSLT